MADRSVVVRLRAEIADFKRKMSEAATAAYEPGSKAADGAAQVSTAMGLIGAAVVGGVAVAVKKFADFDQSMSNVAATGEDARQSISALRDAALEAGATTTFSATEAAGAIEELAKAGVSAKDILGGGLNGALALAASDNLALADAASYTATALNQFKLKGSDATHVADLLAAGAGKAMGGVDDMGQALKQAGLVASGMGISIEETTGSLAAFAQQGLLGSDAGTSLKTMLQALANPSKESAQLMEELGISAYDTSGNFVGMADLAGQLRGKLQGLTQAQRDQAMAQIFGSDAVRAARVLYDEGKSGIEEWTAAVDDQGFASEQAATKLDNLKGDIEGFSGAMETAMITAGEGANGPLRSLVQRGTELVNAWSSLPTWLQQGTLLIAGVGGAGLLAVAGLMKFSASIRDGVSALKDMGTISDATGDKITKWGGRAAKAAGVATAAFAAAQVAAAAFGDEFEGLSAVEWESKFRKAGDGADFLKTSLDGIAGETYSLSEAGERLTNAGWLDSFDDWSGDVLGMASSADTLTTEFNNMGQALANMYATDPQEAGRLYDEILKETGISTEELLDLMPAYRDALLAAENAQGTAGEATAATTEEIVTQTEELENLADAQRDAAGNVLSLRDAQVNMEDAVATATETLKTNGATLDITTEKGRQNRTALDNVAKASWDVITSMQKNGATQAELQGVMSTSRERFIGVATAMGMGAAEANALADEMGLIPKEVKPIISVNTSDAQAAVERFVAMASKQTIYIQTRIKDDPTYTPARAQNQIPRNRGGIIGYAAGGLLGGTPPADPTQDNLLAFSTSGQPYALRSGEFIQSQPAVDHYGVGLMYAINNRQIPKELFAGRYAGGGYFAPKGYTPPARPAAAPAPVAGPQITVQVDASGVIDNDVAAAIATRAERKFMDAYHTFGLSGITSGVAV